jgi:hypothetical protein
MREMPVCAIEMVRQIRAALAPFFPIGTKHEVINNQLTAAIEEIRQSLLAVCSIENVLLFHLNPWQFAPMAAHFVTQSCQLFFPRQQILACDEPLSF